jgi:hypothetical protein
MARPVTRHVIIETTEDGTQNVWGPFRSEGEAQTYVRALSKYAAPDASDYFVTIMSK